MIAAGLAPPDQRMAQQRHQRNRSSGLGNDFCQKQEHTSRRCLREGAAGTVVGLDIPPAQMLHDTARKAAIGRDDGDAPFGCFQGLARKQSDRLRLGFRRCRFHQPDTRQTPFVRRQVDPPRAGFRRQEQRADGMGPFW